MFCVAMALSFKVEVVVFSPASRASRKLLERMHEFVVLLGLKHRVRYTHSQLPSHPSSRSPLSISFRARFFSLHGIRSLGYER